jgi:four helix bundle protein
MKAKTPNRELPIVRWIENGRAKKDAPVYGTNRQKRLTPNVQRLTPNAQPATNPRFNLEDRLLEFSARIIRFVDALPNTRTANHVGGQILRSGTSPYGNHGEVEAAESRKDFVHKLRVSLKELKETKRWRCLIKKSEMVPEKNMLPILEETEELIRIVLASVRTAEKNGK